MVLGLGALLIVAGILAGASGLQCRDWCGEKEIKFPFGVDPGCGDPEHRLNCEGSNLTVSFEQFSFPIASVDYDRDQLVLNTTSMIHSHPGNLSCEAVPLDREAYNVTVNGSILCKPGVGLGSDSFEKQYKAGACEFDRGDPLEPQPFLDHLTCFNYSKKALVPQGSYGNESLVPPWPFVSYVVIPWLIDPEVEQKCHDCETSATKGVCGYDTTSRDLSFLCFCRDSSSSWTTCDGNVISDQNDSSSTSNAGIISAVGGGVILVGMLLAICMMIYRRLRYYISSLASGGVIFVGMLLARTDSPDLHQLPDSTASVDKIVKYFSTREAAWTFSYQELYRATQGFSDRVRLGRGGFGTVYKGKLDNGLVIAVKRANRSGISDEFLNEVRILSQVNHKNLVKLLGWCTDKKRSPMLVYEYVANGTLFEHLQCQQFNKQPLSWQNRLRIAVETAEALCYLHSAAIPPIFHRDVKSCNILLDEHLSAKVADFGISKLVPLTATHVSTGLQGTPGYLDPEYFQSFKFSAKSDVYSFGMVLLELVTGQKAVDLSREDSSEGGGSLANLAWYSLPLIRQNMVEALVDPKLLGAESDWSMMNIMKMMANMAERCLSLSSADRPSMKQVAEALQRLQGKGPLLSLA